MTNAPKPEPRDEKALSKEIRRRIAGYLPDWLPGDSGADVALLAIAARYFSVIGARLNRTPDKNLLAFLETAGIERIPAQSARAPIVCVPVSDGGDGRLPERSRITAPPPPGSGEQIIFETENDLGLAAAQLLEVRSVVPGRDQFADHSTPSLEGSPFEIFSDLEATEHIFYLGHRTILNLAGETNLKVSFSLAADSSERLDIIWEHWDGKVWRPFENVLEKCDEETREDLDGTNGLTRSGSVTLRVGCAITKAVAVNGVENFWVRGRLLEPLPSDPAQTLPLVESVRLQTVITQPLRCVDTSNNNPINCAALNNTTNSSSVSLKAGLLPDKAFAGVEPIDLTKTFYPLGQTPLQGSAFYFTSEELFSKPKSRASMFLKIAETPEKSLNDLEPSLLPEINWEYWNGTDWIVILAPPSSPPADPAAKPNFVYDGVFSFDVPEDMQPLEINNVEGRWMRARLVSGSYVTMTVQSPPGITFFQQRPPALVDFRLGYTWESAREAPEAALAFNDFQFQDFSIQARYPGRPFQPFSRMADRTPTLYFGFDRKLPVDFLGIFFNIEEKPAGEEGPATLWEYWDGGDWRRIDTLDETGGFSRPGIVSLIGPADAQSLARFGTLRYWLRARLREDGPAPRNLFNAVYLNAVWASQRRTVRDETLGESAGDPRVSYQFTHFPVLAGEIIEVREINGPLAEIEYPILRDELGEKRVRAVTDQAGKVIEVWVRWESRPHLFFSGAADRHYVVNRSEGRLFFGDGVNGKVPPPRSVIVAREYQAGGGRTGNLPARAVNQPPGGAGLEAVFNALAAEGGTDAEPADAIAGRGPRTLRHRGRAMTARDYEVMAREAAPEVAWVRVFPASDARLGRRPGHILIMILPETQDPRPRPSFGLRERVRKYLESRSLASLCDIRCIHITGPEYFPIDVEVAVVPKTADEAGTVSQGVRAALEDFLHPLRGGPRRNGWELGRDVFLSDVAGVVESVPGVDFAREITLLRDHAPQGERVAVPRDRLVVAGEILVRVLLQ